MSLKDFSLEGNVAIVTGAGRGIGKGIALAFAEAGADIVAAARTKGEIEGTARQVRQIGRRALAIPTDITKTDQVEAMTEKAVKEFGKIDILVNNAGTAINKAMVYTPEMQAFPSDKSLTDEEWLTVINTNLTSVFLCCRAVGAHMIKQQHGKVVNISSNRSFRAATYRVPYTAAKGGINQLTKCLALEWARYNIQVNAIAPGLIRTQLNEEYWQGDGARGARLTREIPARRPGEPREVGLMAVYLASPASNYVTGQVLVIDGGVAL